MGIAWSSVPLPDMAQRVGLGRFVFLAYTMPLLNAHPTIKGTLGRLQGEEHGPIGIKDRTNPELADRVLSTAHALLILMLEVIINRFPAEGLEEMFAQLDKDYPEIWKPKTQRAAT
jgi:hypothetical protein